jgi:hypothetical protein
VGPRFNFRDRIGRGDREPGSGEEREIRQIVPHDRHFAIMTGKSVEEGVIFWELFFQPLINCFNPQFRHPTSHGARAPAAEDSREKPHFLPCRKGETVVDIKSLERLTPRTVEELTVSQDPVHIEHEQADSSRPPD